MNVQREIISVIQMQTVPTFMGHSTVLANMDIEEMVLIAKVWVKYSSYFISLSNAA